MTIIIAILMGLALIVLAVGVSRAGIKNASDTMLMAFMASMLVVYGVYAGPLLSNRGDSRVIEADRNGYYSTTVDGVKEWWRRANAKEVEMLESLAKGSDKAERNVYKQSVNEGRK